MKSDYTPAPWAGKDTSPLEQQQSQFHHFRTSPPPSITPLLPTTPPTIPPTIPQPHLLLLLAQNMQQQQHTQHISTTNTTHATAMIITMASTSTAGGKKGGGKGGQLKVYPHASHRYRESHIARHKSDERIHMHGLLHTNFLLPSY
jgi:hypothetical protein